MAISRRGYPILGHHKLRYSDASITASKPVYLRLEILRWRSQDQYGEDPETGPETGPEADPGSSILRLDPSISDLI